MLQKHSVVSRSDLTIVTGRTCVLLNSAHKFIEIEAWLLLTFFICLHNQPSSIHFIASHTKEYEQGDSSNRQKMKGCSFQQHLQQNLS